MAITLRLVKGSELTFAEVDDNFKSLFYSASLDGNELKLFYYPGTSYESVDLSSISTDTGSFLITGSIANGTITLEKGDGTTFDLIYNSGSFSGSFTGDGSNLTGLPIGSLWTSSASDIYYDLGNVGIGTEFPSQSLHVQSSGPTSVLVDSQTTENAQLILQHSNTGGSGDKNSAVVFKRDSTTYWTVGLNGINGASNNEFVIANGTSFDVSPILVINQSSGNTGLGLGAGNNPTNILELGGANSNYSSLRIVTQSGTPSSPQNGQLRNDNGTPYWYDGTSWIDLSATGSGGGGATFPYTGSAEITGSLSVTGSTTLSGSGNQILTVEGSGSSNPIFTVNGSLGELFTVTDSLSGSLFAVNNISGLSILDVQSDNRILMGNPTYPSLNTTVRVSTTASGNIIYEIPTSSYEGAFFEYTVQSASNARAGSIMTTWIPGTSNIVSTETTTTDIGSTSGVSFTTIITGSNIALTASVGDDTWIVKTIVRSI